MPPQDLAVDRPVEQWGRVQPIVGGAIPGLEILDSIRKQAEQAMSANQ